MRAYAAVPVSRAVSHCRTVCPLLFSRSLVAGALALALFTVAGYPALLRLRAGARRSPIDDALGAADARRVAGAPSTPPRVTVIIATRDAPAAIVDRVQDLRRGEFPDDRLDIVVAIDVTQSYTRRGYRAMLEDMGRVVLRRWARGQGRNAERWGARGNRGRAPLADSAQRFGPTVIRDLVDAVHADGVGAVAV